MTTKDFQRKSPLAIFLRYFDNHKGLFAVDVLCAVLIAAIDLMFPLVTRSALYDRIVLVLAPFEASGQFLLGILDFALFGAELLTEFYGACRADFNALAAGYALFFFNVGTVSGCGKVRRIEVLAGAQCKADTQVAVAETENFVLAVDVGDLVDIAVFFSTLADVQSLFLGNRAALAGFNQVLGKVAETDAAVVLDLAGAFAEETAGIAAGAVTDRKLSFIFVQPV